MQLFLPENLGFQVTPNDLQMARALQTMYPVPRRAPLYPNGLNGLGDQLQLLCPPTVDCSVAANPGGGGPESPDSNCCMGEANPSCPSGWNFYGQGCIAQWNPATSPANNTNAPPVSTPACPVDWTGTYPDCIAPSTLPSTTTYSTPVTTTPVTSGNTLSPGSVTSTTPVTSSPAGSTSSTGSTTSTSSSTSTGNWFTDPTQELISGIPNWGIVAAAGVGLLLLIGGKKL